VKKGGFLMISPVSMASASRLHFGDAAQDRLAREGAYSKAPQDVVAPEAAEKKSGKGKKWAIAGIVVVAAAALLAVLSRRDVFKFIPEEQLKDAKFFKKVGHYLHQAGEYIAKYTWDPVRDLFKAGEKAADKAGEAAGKASEAVGEAAGKAGEAIGEAGEAVGEAAGKVGEAVEEIVK
jgi:hypothetical protein